ncbi:class I SAM-dependent methyltransferase [Microbacterium jejuense]|uniref:Class I SAM-dependent methyltransferase n=1 Tax=Microbacterium jejuense TaxID=1263637 RepID=A0ABS7HRV7_9MICO|nr:class I SAM-dependent methyltransferase [Microbacterium jejuense]MBW9095691.1 class I SAM-dependent methyltransferase [Microbacterium jejuense]
MERSALLPILSRARDAEHADPILGDTWACRVRDGLDVDWEALGLPQKEAFTVAMRGRHLDDWVRQFLAVHPDAVVVDLGAGLDDRSHRIMPGPDVDWFDIDFGQILDLRRRLSGDGRAENVHELAVDATSAEWVSRLPADRPLVIVADGFFPFLRPDDSAAVVHRLIDHAPEGELLMNGYTTLAQRLMPRVRAIRDLGIDISGGTAFDDPHVPEQWHPRLRLVERIMLSRSPYVAQTSAGLRASILMMNLLPGVADRSDLGVLRLQFSARS